MSDVIDLGNHPLAKKLRDKELEIERLRVENIALRQAISKIVGTNDMLKLQMNELVTVINNFQTQLQNITVGLNALKTNLPNIIIDDERK